MSAATFAIRRRGLSLPEIMIGLAITVLLLTATAAAFNASAQAVSMNDKFFRASQSARVSLNQVLTEIRRCDAVSVTTSRVPAGISSSVNVTSLSSAPPGSHQRMASRRSASVASRPPCGPLPCTPSSARATP